MSKITLLRPRLSEKTYGLALAKTVYVFDVPADVNKQTVAAAVAAQFEVTPVSVNIVNVKGKTKRSVRKGGRAIMGQRSDLKKAYVTLAQGQKLPFFDEPEAKDDKKDKKAETKKAAKKETK
ncbi:MAG TPA: 50S ribosomal protein L23 [Candidatus Saccharimonadales bacterium]|nr:50S ribosomal protein L23 [Candidatus Saccharimonadales bacterium]